MWIILEHWFIIPYQTRWCFTSFVPIHGKRGASILSMPNRPHTNMVTYGNKLALVQGPVPRHEPWLELRTMLEVAKMRIQKPIQIVGKRLHVYDYDNAPFYSMLKNFICQISNTSKACLYEKVSEYQKASILYRSSYS